jgi:hypothetical protein
VYHIESVSLNSYSESVDFAGFVLIITILGISIYDFYILRKSGVKISSCLSSSFITLIINLVVFIVGMLIGSAIFGDGNDFWLIISIVLVLAFSYFRFKGREISKGEVKVDKKKEKKLTPKEKQIEAIKTAAAFGFFSTVATIVLLFFLKKDNSSGYFILFVDPAIIGFLAYWTYKKLSFWSCLGMTSYFIIGKLMMILPVYAAGGSGSAGVGMAVVITYFMIKGVIGSYKHNFKK